MVDTYLILKVVHVATSIIALGTSAGLGVLLEFYGSHPQHGLFVLRAIRRLEWMVVVPGYVIMPATGLWMVHEAWSLSNPWIKTALVLWAASLTLLLAFLWVFQRQIRAFEQVGPAGGNYQRLSLAGRVLGAAAGLMVLLLVYDMVVKPTGFLGW